MTKYAKLNNLFGWLCFLIATTVYTLTLEPTSSFWDCGEYISSAYKLQVCHQPGAPLFLMISRVLTLFASDVSQVAWWVNFGSALCGGATILFLFWSTTHLAKKLVKTADSELSGVQIALIMGAGMVGALAYTFSDTFWFLTVEAEVYAMSSLCTAVVFWAILKWEHEADKPNADRWLIFIAYMVGLSIGVRLLSLLAMPALGMLYYYKRYNVTLKGSIIAFLSSCLIVVIILYGIIPGTVSLGAKFDLFFVNSLGLFFGSGALVFLMLLIGGLTYLLLFSIKKQNYVLNLSTLCVIFIFIGYSTFAMIVIRAFASPNLNNNDPSNAYSLLSYLNREQYGDNPLIYGPMYNSKIVESVPGSMMYRRGPTKYEEVGYRPKYIYDKNVLFPRMYSEQLSHQNFYKSWLDIKGQPTYWNNIEFFLGYQINYMYFRYFMWNFAGRQNDVQGHGSVAEGNWISGIKFLDEIRLGNQDELPKSITENKGYHRLYFLPLLLGLAGFMYQYNRNTKDFSVVFLLFFMTGIAIVLYLNQTPLQPRERDYAYTSSFYAFAIWIGLGVLAVHNFFAKKLNTQLAAGLSITLSLVAVPILMAAEEWGSHDRSQRYTVRDLAANYLNSCAPNAIIFTYGDNDTYPLWYCQEVEGIRTDVRLVNLSLLGTDWYGRQMKNKMNDSEGLTISIPNEKFAAGVRDYILFYDQQLKGYEEMTDIIEFVTSDNPAAKATTQGGEQVNFLPTKNFKITIDKEKMVKNRLMTRQEADTSLNSIEWKYTGSALYKNDLLALTIIAENIHQRPIYFAVTVPDASYYGLQDYFRNEGFAYRIIPSKSKPEDNAFGREGSINTDILYNNMMNKFVWGNYNSGKIYIDPESSRMTVTCDVGFITLAQALYTENKIDSCIKVLDAMNANIPFIKNSVGYGLLPNYLAAELYYECNQPEKAEAGIRQITGFITDQLNYYHSMGLYGITRYKDEISFGLSMIAQMQQTAEDFHDEEMTEELSNEMTMLHKQFQPFMGK